jgi:alcohol dehydrogenase
VETSDTLWTSTGIRALDHIVEALYSQYGHSFTDALAVKGLHLLLRHLPSSVEDRGSDAWIAHRGHCLTAAALSNFAAFNTRYGISHAFGHKIGPKWNVPHGITSCISLPYAMRVMAELAPERFEALAGGLGIHYDPAKPREAALACALRIDAFIQSLGLPRSLEEVGVPRDELDEVAELIRDEIEWLDTAGAPVTLDIVRGMLHAMHPRPRKPILS